LLFTFVFINLFAALVRILGSLEKRFVVDYRQLSNQPRLSSICITRSHRRIRYSYRYAASIKCNLCKFLPSLALS